VKLFQLPITERECSSNASDRQEGLLCGSKFGRVVGSLEKVAMAIGGHLDATVLESRSCTTLSAFRVIDHEA
jgi:hypothetical protein